jgi:O-antigen ligase
MAGPRRTAAALAGAAAIQGFYGILVLASDEPRILHLPKQHYLDCATGTFVNRNHYAGWLAMALACGLGLLLDEVARIRRGARGARAWAGPEAGKVLLLGLALVVGTAGLLTSFSRAGIAVGAVALGLTALAGTGAGRLRTRLAVALVVAAAGVLPLLQLGSAKLVARYADTAEHLVSEGGRARVWSDGLRMAAAFPATGAGFGTFAAAYPAFRSPDVRFFYAHAHNDLVQVAAEAGVLGSILVLALVASVGRALVRAFQGALGIAGVGVAAAVVAILLHALVDFHFHVPANAATAAVLVGLLEGMAWRQNAST